MAKRVKVEVITPSSKFYSGEVELVVVRTLVGAEGFMAGHTWACKLLDVGALKLYEKDQEHCRLAAIAGGYIDVKDSILIYTDDAVWKEDIDLKATKEKIKEMEAFISSHVPSDAHGDVSLESAEGTLARLKNMVYVAEGLDKGKH